MTALALHQAPAFADPGTESLLPVYRRLPVELVRGAGVELFDADGRAYLDFTSGIAVNALGYADPGLEAAMHEAMRDGIIPPTLNLENQDPEIELDVVHGEARKGEIEYALNNSFGFGGHNVALVVTSA